MASSTTVRKWAPPPGSGMSVELTNLLWKLKHRYQKHHGGYVPLNMLISDPAYLSSVLEGAMKSGVADLVAVALEIRSFERPASDQGFAAPTAPSGMPSTAVRVPRAPANAAPAARPPNRRVLVLAAATLGVFMLAALAVLLSRPAPADRDAAATIDAPATVAIGADALAPAVMPVPALRLHGSNTVGENLALALIEGMLRQRGYLDVQVIDGATRGEKTVFAAAQGTSLPALSIEVHAHGSSTAFADLLDGSADMGMASRSIKETELDALLPRAGRMDSPAAEHVIALDGLAVIVHPSNPLGSLTSEQVARLFAGELADWSQLGGHAGPVNVYARDEHSGTWDTFKSLVLERIKADLGPTAKRFESSTELSDSVARDPGAIGFIGLPYVRRAKVLAIGETAESLAILPTSFTVSTEDYPLSRRLYFYTPPTGGNPIAAELAEFALGHEGQALVEKSGFISQDVRSEKPERSSAFPAAYLELTDGAERLSLNFRFQYGSDQLDNKAQRDLQRLVDHLAQNREQRVMLLGFADSSGSPAVNQVLSQRRAEALEMALQARGVHPATVRGFGHAIALASNDTEAGRNKNRRVEVWVR